MLTRKELIKKYIEFFKSKDHKEIPSSSLVPANDPTVLFTTAGMQQLVPYLLGQKHPLGKRIVDVQKCIRTRDIEAVGDTYHHTFFEMLGNWSIGDYWKEDAIKMTYEFHTEILGISKDNYAVTCFGGDKDFPDIPKDEQSQKIWDLVGVPKDRIAFIGGGVSTSDDNWWGPAGATGPCGPCTEQFFWRGKEKAPDKFDPKDKNWVEIGNDVLMGYVKNSEGKFVEADQKNIDFGGGVERTLSVLNGFSDNYLTDVWQPIIQEIEEISDHSYNEDQEKTKAMRVIADHLKASCFIISDGVIPSNTERGYVLRRLIRRAVRYGRILGLREFTRKVASTVFDIYTDYEGLVKNKSEILNEIEKEETKFNLTLEQGIKVFENLCKQEKIIDSKNAFLLYQSYGFPIEMTLELAEEAKIKVDKEGFDQENKKHQELSRTASAGTFKSGLADNSDATKRLHTATHLLNEALRVILGKEVKQKGSNITPERLRFDFNFDRKLTPEEIKGVEDWVNEKIKKSLEVKKEEMPLELAINTGAQGEFGNKYPEIVSVYTILDKDELNGFASKEICTGPHVENTKEIGVFKILKEESSSGGVRRIKAIIS